jgi:SdrD B-like protein/carbohydrate binding protein with CBM6 domain
MQISPTVGQPTTVEAENFDRGGLGVAYFKGGDLLPSQYRYGQYVTVSYNGKEGHFLSPYWTAADDWLEYSVNAAASGTYDVEFRVTSPAPDPGGSFHLEVDGVDVTGSLSIPLTSVGAFTTLTRRAVPLAAGPHVLRLVFDTANRFGDAGGVGSIRFVPVTAPTNGSVAGAVFNDADGDGTRDSGETGIGGRTVFLDTDNDSVLDAGERSALTAVDGTYSVPAVPPGAYTVRQVLPSGWHQTKPSGTGGYALTLAAGQTVTGRDFGSTKAVPTAGSIGGSFFNDLDADGSRDTGEPALPGWRVFIDADKDGVFDTGEKTALTDPAGNYKFTSLAAGTYRVRDVVQSGFRAVNPSKGYHDVTLAAGQNLTRNFANTQKALISGNVYNDLNGGGGKNSGEPNLAGWRVYLDADNDGVFDSTEKNVLTDASGNYKFATLAPGAYRVRVVALSGWRWSQPSSGSYSLTLSSGGAATGKNFGATRNVLISGAVFNDLDADKTRDSNESGLSGWRVFIDTDKDGVLDSGEKSVLTDSSGNWSFKDLAAGTYVVRLVQPPGWTRTTPTSGSHTLTLAAGKTSTNRLFGVRRTT